MTGELVPKSKLDKDNLDQLFAAQTRLVEEIKDALRNPLRAISNGLNVADRDVLLAQCVERYKGRLPMSVLVNTVFATPFAFKPLVPGGSRPF